jgi:uncharacterized repeat protein (TIGR03803 family)
MKAIYIFRFLLLIAFLLCNKPARAQGFEIYGLSQSGGYYKGGAIYKNTDQGTFRAIKSLVRVDGFRPQSTLCLTSGGKLYGTTPYGGRYGFGILYEWDPLTGNYTKKFDFDDTTSGKGPLNALIQAANQKLYGLAFYSAPGTIQPPVKGFLFEWDPETDRYSKKVDLSYENGCGWYGSLVEAENGLIYGITSSGGNEDMGTIFEWDPVNNSLTKKLDFNDTLNGAHAQSAMVQSENGKFYGMTREGGINGLGVLFEWDPVTGDFNKLIDFDGSCFGSHPEGSLVKADNGKYYGLTYDGGLNNCGVLFEWDPNERKFTKKMDFGNEKIFPRGSLTKLMNGRLLGTTYEGVFFEWNPANDDFKMVRNEDDWQKGYAFNGSMIQLESGKVYGTSENGGITRLWAPSTSDGILYEWDPADSLYTIKLFYSGAMDGSYPRNIVEAGYKFYGTASGGTSESGTIFEYDPDLNRYTKKFDFDPQHGIYPGPITKANDGKLYGYTYSTIEHGNNWTFFSWDPEKNSFKNYSNTIPGPPSAMYSRAALVSGDGNKMYGIGGNPYSSYMVNLFEVELDSMKFTSKIVLENRSLLLFRSVNGKFYGVTFKMFNDELFEWDPKLNLISQKLDSSSFHFGSLADGKNGKLYGNCMLNGKNILFEWDPITNNLSEKVDLDTMVVLPYPPDNFIYNLTADDNGMMYGTINDERESDYYVFQWNPSNNDFRKFADVPSSDSATISQLIIRNKPEVHDTLNIITCNFYLSPNGKYIWDQSGQYNDTLTSVAGYDSILTVHLTVLKQTESTFTITACDPYISPGGKTWTHSGIYMDTIPNVAGCDSIITVNLTINAIDKEVLENNGIVFSVEPDAVYQWIHCDDNYRPVEGQTGPSFNPVISGHYAVIISHNGCIDTSNCISVIMTNLPGNPEQKILLYPNPNNGSFFMDMGKDFSTAVITISDMKGNVLHKIEGIASEKTELKLEDPPGMYIITVYSGNKRAVFTIVRQL